MTLGLLQATSPSLDPGLILCFMVRELVLESRLPKKQAAVLLLKFRCQHVLLVSGPLMHHSLTQCWLATCQPCFCFATVHKLQQSTILRGTQDVTALCKAFMVCRPS